MGTRRRQSDRAGRAKMRSPGRPPVLHRSAQRPFWRAIAEGCSSEDAARRVGIAPAVGVRWFREYGGMPPSQLAPSAPPPTGRYLSLVEREQIAILRAQRHGVREIARRLAGCASTISRELRRNPRRRLRVSRDRGKSFITPEILISERPATVADRAVPGHWEGDLILGLRSSAIGTLVERTTRFTMLLHLPRLPGHADQVREKNGPALAGHGAEAVRDAITRTMASFPEQLRRSLTWDQGAEMSQHAKLRIDTGLQVYFCNPNSPWQRGTNENTYGLLRQYFPKGTHLSIHSTQDLEAVALTLNTRPRKTLHWRTPAEALTALLRSTEIENVATPG